MDLWLKTKLPFTENRTNYDIIKEIQKEIYDWIYEHPEIILTIDYNEFLKISFLYLINSYVFIKEQNWVISSEKQEEMDYIQVKYSDDIYTLFKYLQDITKSNNSDLFHTNSNCEPLIYFISYYCDSKDPYNDDMLSIDTDDDIFEYEFYNKI